MENRVIMFDMGGPCKKNNIINFLYRLFSDKLIIDLPIFIRQVIAVLISIMRYSKSKKIYSFFNYKSPIINGINNFVTVFDKINNTIRYYICMRYSDPKLKAVDIDFNKKTKKLVLFPFYPQYSTTTIESFIKYWNKNGKSNNKYKTVQYIYGYSCNEYYIDLLVSHIKKQIVSFDDYYIIYTAHAIPVSYVNKGDPYEKQINITANLISSRLNIKNFTVCYQSKLGPIKWLYPSISKIIVKYSNKHKNLVIVPLSFMFENIETLYELDVKYKKLAIDNGVNNYIRIGTIGTLDNYSNFVINYINYI